MNKAYLLIGGNIGDRKDYLEQARRQITIKAGPVIQASHLYETAAWGKTDQEAFLNQALLITTNLKPEALLNILLEIELELGRKRLEKNGPRTIDIDILFYDDIVLNSSRLALPHPAMQHRRFALEPLAEIAPLFQHPVFNKDIVTLLNECKDQLPVHKLNN